MQSTQSSDSRNSTALVKKESFELAKDIYNCAGKEGHLEILKRLRFEDFSINKEKCPWDSDACAYAAKAGFLKGFNWLNSEKPPCEKDTCASAAEGRTRSKESIVNGKKCPLENSENSKTFE